MSECFVCGNTFNLHNSHDIPKYIGGKDSDGRRLLCPIHHRQYDLYLLKKFLKAMNISYIINNWLDVKEYQIAIKKEEGWHPKLQKLTKQILKTYFTDNKKKEIVDECFCIFCEQEIDIEDYFFDNICKKCFNPQDNKHLSE